MKNFVSIILLLFCANSISQTPIYNERANLVFFNFTTNGEDRLDYSGNQAINLKVTAGMYGINFNISQTSYNVKIKLFAKKSGSNPVLIGNDDNVPILTSSLSSSANKDFFITLNRNDFPPGSILYCIVERFGAQYSFQSRNYSITDCIQTPAPINISATPYSYGYTIGFSPS